MWVLEMREANTREVGWKGRDESKLKGLGVPLLPLVLAPSEDCARTNATRPLLLILDLSGSLAAIGNLPVPNRNVPTAFFIPMMRLS